MRWRLYLTGVRWRARRARCRATDRLEHARFVVLSAVLNRFAPREWRHAALLLGYDMAAGLGTEGLLLGPLHEFSLGAEIGYEVRHGTPAERAAALEAFRLECGLYARPAETCGMRVEI